MGQVRHTDEGTTLRIYAKVLNRDRRHVGVAVDEMIAEPVTNRPGPQRVAEVAIGPISSFRGTRIGRVQRPPGARAGRLNQVRLPDDAARKERIVVSEVVSTEPATLSWRACNTA